MNIPFNKPPKSRNETEYVLKAIANNKLSGEGPFNKACAQWLEKNLPTQMSVITPSCTSALEMAMVLANISPGDEVILPSFTFTSTANVVAIYGGVPVFVDVESKTMNIDVTEIKKALTAKTKAIIPVHYAGVGCRMDEIMALADENKLYVVEDAAQGMFAKYKGKALGVWGHMGAFSYHETKNIVCGEGGALTLNSDHLLARAEIVRDKGTNRQEFLNGQVDKYTWQDVGSSYLLSELSAAFLLAQLEDGLITTQKRQKIWKRYNENLQTLESQGFLERMHVPDECEGNGHIYYILLRNAEIRHNVLQSFKEAGIQATTHYVPLHSAPAGRKLGRTSGDLRVTTDQANRLLRLPMFADLSFEEVEYVCEQLEAILRRNS